MRRRRVGEHVVGLHRLVHREPIRGQYGGVEPAALDQGQQLWDGARVHQPGGDGDILDPELLQVKGRRLAVHAHVGERPAGSYQLCGQLERGRDSDGLHGDIGAKSAGQLINPLDRILAAVVDGDVGAEFLGLRQAPVVEVDHDDPGRGVQLRGHDRRQADRARAHYGHGVARPHAAVLDAYLERGRKDVGQEKNLLIGESRWNLVKRVVRKRDTRVFGLKAVDQVTEDPSTAACALAVAGLLADPAAATRGDAGNQDVVADLEVGDAGTGLDNCAHSLVTKNRARLYGRHIALEEVKVGAADGGGVDLDDGVGRRLNGRVGYGVPGPESGSVIDECFHGVFLF